MDLIDLLGDERDTNTRRDLVGDIAAEQRRQTLRHIENHAITEGSRLLLYGEAGLREAVGLLALASRSIARLSSPL